MQDICNKKMGVLALATQDTQDRRIKHKADGKRCGPSELMNAFALRASFSYDWAQPCAVRMFDSEPKEHPPLRIDIGHVHAKLSMLSGTLVHWYII